MEKVVDNRNQSENVLNEVLVQPQIVKQSRVDNVLVVNREFRAELNFDQKNPQTHHCDENKFFVIRDLEFPGFLVERIAGQPKSFQNDIKRFAQDKNSVFGFKHGQ